MNEEADLCKWPGEILSSMRSATLLALKTAIRKANFPTNWRRDGESGGPMSRIYAKTVAMSYDHLGWTEGGFRRNNALMNLEIRGCSSSEGVAKGDSKEDIADLCTPIVFHERFLTE